MGQPSLGAGGLVFSITIYNGTSTEDVLRTETFLLLVENMLMMMADLHCQLYWLYTHLGDTLETVYVRAFPGKIS